MIPKKGASAFFGTNLAAVLTAAGVDTVVICGATTSGCVRASAVDSVQSGFPTLVVRECVGDRAEGPHEANLFDIDAKYGDVISLEDALAYVAGSDPGDREAVPAASFRAPGGVLMAADVLRADVAALEAESRTVDAGGLKLHVLDYPGEGRGVLVLPGITSPAISWDFVVRSVRDGLRFLVPDTRGRGLSDTPAGGGYSLGDYAGDVAAIVRGLGLERPVLLGHSMGARIATTFAARHPELRGPVIAVDPPLSGPGRDPYPITSETFLDQLEQARAGVTVDELRAHYPRWPERELELRARWLETCAEEAVAASHRGFHDEDFFDDWPQVAAPVAFVYGGDSPMVTADGAAEAARRNAAARMVRVPDAGHMIPWDNLDGFQEAVAELLPLRQPLIYDIPEGREPGLMTGTSFVDMCREELSLCGIAAGSTVAVLSQGDERPNYADAFLQAARSSRRPRSTCASTRRTRRSTATSARGPSADAAGGQPPAIEALKGADLVVDLIFLLFSKEQIEIQERARACSRASSRSTTWRGCSRPRPARRVEPAGRCSGARSTALHEPAGTDVTYQLGAFPVITEYGYTDTPGRWDHWPSGFLFTGGADDGVDGRVVIAPGDIVFPFKTYVQTPIELTIEAGRIEPTARASTPSCCATTWRASTTRRPTGSRTSAGACTRRRAGRARTDRRSMGMDGRCFYGNVLFSTGPNGELGGPERHAVPHRRADAQLQLYLDGGRSWSTGTSSSTR